MHDTTITPYVSLCSGYEGIGLGLHRAIPNLRCIAYCEREAFAIANLVEKMEAGLLDEAPVFPDVTSFPWAEYAPFMANGILSFGWPCQPVSCAGKRKATEDERWLFDIIADGIAVMRPGWLFAENVEGLLSAKMPDGSSVFGHCITRLESLHYKVAAGIFSASEVGAPHQRKRVFILAHRIGAGLEGFSEPGNRGSQPGRYSQEEGRPVGTGGVWQPVSFAADCLGGDGFELGDECSVCGGIYTECPCPGPTQDGYEYAEIDGELYARPYVWPSRPGEPQHGWEPPRVVGNADSPRQQERQGQQREAVQRVDADGGEGAGGQIEPTLGRDFARRINRVVHAELYTSCDNRTDELRLLGNGVVPATAHKAFITLMEELT